VADPSTLSFGESERHRQGHPDEIGRTNVLDSATEGIPGPVIPSRISR
jgi:hypothetical protein